MYWSCVPIRVNSNNTGFLQRAMPVDSVEQGAGWYGRVGQGFVALEECIRGDMFASETLGIVRDSGVVGDE